MNAHIVEIPRGVRARQQYQKWGAQASTPYVGFPCYGLGKSISEFGEDDGGVQEDRFWDWGLRYRPLSFLHPALR